VPVDGDGDGGVAVFYSREHFAPEVSASAVRYPDVVVCVLSPGLASLVASAELLDGGAGA
jgi:hypothetical protein